MRLLISFLIASTASLSLAAPSRLEKRAGSVFQFFGVNESGPEFAPSNLPGALGPDYSWPNTASFSTFMNQGMNTFRVNFLMERLTANTMEAPFDATYLAALKDTVKKITSQGAYAIIVPHNSGRYYNKVITDVAGFQAWWKRLATEFASDGKVIFDINNEFYGMDQALVVQLNQAGINGIRAAGASSQYITVEGNAWTGAWSWVSSGNGATMGSLKDPSDKILYQMHQYLDGDSSGTSDSCVSATIGQERLQAATSWLRSTGNKGIIGEFAGGNNDVCEAAVEGALNYLKENADVWKGVLWWACGTRWGKGYIFSLEPNEGIGYSRYMPLLAKYA